MAEAYMEFTIDPIAEANKLAKGLRNKAIRIAMNKAGGKVKAAVVSKAPVRYGYLQKSIRVKVRQYKASAVWVAIVGPKSDFRKVRKAKAGRKETTHRPSNYARLVERGTRHARAHPFLAPALAQTKSLYLTTLVESISSQVAQLLPKI